MGLEVSYLGRKKQEEILDCSIPEIDLFDIF